MNAETLWIDCDPDDMPDMGFLVEINHENTGSTAMSCACARRTPIRAANQGRRAGAAVITT
jgi:hypothetical protein